MRNLNPLASTRSQWPAAVLWSIALAGWLGWVAWGLVAQPRFRLVWVCEIPLGLVFLLPQLAAALRRHADLFSGPTVFGGYVFAQEGLWTAYLLTTGQPHMHSTIATYLPELPLVLLYTALALALFQFPWALQPRAVPPPPRQWQLARLRALALALPVAALLAFYLFLVRVGGLSAYLASLGSNRVTELTGLWGYVMFAESVLTLGCACAVMLAALDAGRWWRAYAAVATAAGVVIGLLAGYRILSLIPLVTVLALWHYVLRPFQITLRGLLIVLLAAVLSSVYSTVRDRPELARAGGWSVVAGAFADPASYVLAVDTVLVRVQGSETLAVVMADTPPNGGFQYGWRAFLQAPAMLIPRALWPDSPFKENPESNRFGTLFFGAAWGTLDQLYGISPTWMAELYWNFGLAGVLLCSLGLGYAMRRIYVRTLRFRSGPDLLLMAYCPLALILLAEAPSNALTGLIVVAAPVLLLRRWLCPRAVPAPRAIPARAWAPRAGSLPSTAPGGVQS